MKHVLQQTTGAVASVKLDDFKLPNWEFYFNFKVYFKLTPNSYDLNLNPLMKEQDFFLIRASIHCVKELAQ